METVEDKRPRRMRYIGIGIVVIIVLIYLFTTVNGSTTTTTTTTNDQSTGFTQFYHDYNKLTELQQESKWQEIKGKEVQWSGKVHDIYKDAIDKNKTIITVAVDGVAYFTAYMSEDNTVDLSKYSKGDLISIQGKLFESGSLMRAWKLSDAKVISK